MRVLLVGGAGAVGGAVLPLLAASPVLDVIVVADRDLAPCQARVSVLDSAVAAAVDAEQTTSVARLIDRYEIDLIVNVAGPYSATLMPVLRAAVDTGINYVDVAEGASETSEALELDSEAKRNGVVCLLGMGNFPGLTNMLAVQAANQLESVSTVAVACAISAAAVASIEATGRTSAGWVSMIEAASRSAHIYTDGTASVAPMGTFKELTTPSGHAVSLALHDHSEPMTLPRHLSTISEVVTCLGFVPRQADDLFRTAAQSVADGGLSASEAVAEFVKNVRDQRQRFVPPSDFPPIEIWAEAEGIMDGRPVRITSWATGPVPPTTRILAGSVEGIASQRIDEPGVRTAESLSTETFLSLIADDTRADMNTLIDERITPLV
jgi:saccharopine dehydrogenase (NAD+, L-lysine-forming)